MKLQIFLKILSSFSKGLLVIFIFLILGLVLIWKNIIAQQTKITTVSPQKNIKLISTPIPSTAPTIAPTIAPTSKPTPISTLAPVYSPTPVPVQNTNIGSYLLSKVNEYRRSQGLYEVTTDPYTCSFAVKRAQEISVNFSHDGFKNYPYPKYARVTENLAMDTSYTDVVNQWINSSIHAEIMREDTPYVCIQSYGNYYAYEGWKP